MILWLAYVAFMSALVSAIALLLDRALRLNRRSARWVWWSAMATTPVFVIAPWISGGDSAGVPNAVSNLKAFDLSLFDVPALLLWSVCMSAVLIRVFMARRSLVLARRSWSEAELSGTLVLVSADVGPGVITLGSARIVVPSWTLQLDTSVQALLIAHEREHIRARDHWLIASGLVLLVCFPIVPLLWWQYSRLKLAIEMDCDARVLSGRQDVRSYAALLLDVGQRCRSGRLALAAFAAPPHSIERRIRMLLDRKPGPSRVIALSCVAGAVAIAAIACQTPEPNAPDLSIREAEVPLEVSVPKPPPPPPMGELIYAETPSKAPYRASNKLGRALFSEAVEEKIVAAERAPRAALRVDEKRLPPPPPPPPLPR
jgi:bla regulator protein blaR1